MKKFKIDGKDIKTIVKGQGGCIASDKITVGGEPVRYMVRSKPTRREDSGWMFMAGTESQAYMDDAANFEVYDVNTIANYDREIVPLLNAPPGSSFERRNNVGPLVPCEGSEVPDAKATGAWPPPGFPLVEGPHALTKSWSLVLPAPYARRIEDGALVLWRPGITLWINAWNNDKGESQAARLAHFKAVASADARDLAEEQRGGCTRLSYRLTEDGVETITALVFSDAGHLQMSVYFDHEGDAPTAAQIVRSVASR